MPRHRSVRQWPRDGLLRFAGACVVVLWRLGESALNRLARQYWLPKLGSCGANFLWQPFGSFILYENLHVGDNVFIGPNARISAKRHVEIGDNTMIGAELFITDGYHEFKIIGLTIADSGPDERAPVVVERDVWIGTRVTILKGIVVGEGSVIGSGTVVTREVPPYSVVAGVPGRVVGLRFADGELREHCARLGLGPVHAERMIERRAAHSAHAVVDDHERLDVDR